LGKNLLDVKRLELATIKNEIRIKERRWCGNRGELDEDGLKRTEKITIFGPPATEKPPAFFQVR
jgi:hypothetical protein